MYNTKSDVYELPLFPRSLISGLLLNLIYIILTLSYHYPIYSPPDLQRRKGGCIISIDPSIGLVFLWIFYIRLTYNITPPL